MGGKHNVKAFLLAEINGDPAVCETLQACDTGHEQEQQVGCGAAAWAAARGIAAAPNQ